MLYFIAFIPLIFCFFVQPFIGKEMAETIHSLFETIYYLGRRKYNENIKSDS